MGALSAQPARVLAALLSECADLVEIEGSDVPRAAAYRRAALGLRDFSGDLPELAARGGLRQIPGVGPVLERKVAEFLASGAIPALEELRATVPAGVRGLLAIRGVGPKLAAAAWRTLGITDAAGLAAACSDGRLARLPGVGAARAGRILAAIAMRGDPALLLAEGVPLADAIAAALDRHMPAWVAGEVRRGCPLVRTLTFVAVGGAGEVSSVLSSLGLRWATQAEQRPEDRDHPWPWLAGALVLEADAGRQELPVCIYLATAGAQGTALLWATGSAAHLQKLAGRAADRGRAAGALAACGEEREVYEVLGLPWIPPELREGWGEVEAAEAGRLLPSGGRLVEQGDLKGDLHCHTQDSDGAADISAMAAAARARGYSYLAVTDHSPALVVARGQSVERLRAQRREIDRLNRAAPAGFRILQGAEVEILRDGSLDYPDDVLAELDFCVASAHQAQGQDGAELTARLVRALANPAVDVIGHPTGRRLRRREPQPVDVPRLASEAARLGKALEINGSPERVDLDADQVRGARAAGLRWCCLDSDAHTPEGLGHIAWAVTAARRAGLGPEDVVNAWPLERLRTWRRRR